MLLISFCLFSVALRQITVILRVLGVNGTAVEFFPIFVNPSAASTAEFLEIVGKVVSSFIHSFNIHVLFSPNISKYIICNMISTCNVIID